MAEPSSVKCWSGCFGRSAAFLDRSGRNVTTGAIGAGRYEGVFLVLAVVLALVTVPLAGGRIGRLAEVRLRWAPLLFAALALQMVILVVVPGWNDALLRAVHLGTYGMLFTFLWVNRRISGIWIVAVGGALNLIAIAANAGVMPAGPAAVRSAGHRLERGRVHELRVARPPAPVVPGLTSGRSRGAGRSPTCSASVTSSSRSASSRWSTPFVARAARRPGPTPTPENS